jgi:hypothetical protein
MDPLPPVIPPIKVNVSDTSTKNTTPPPLVDLKVTNPIVYIKAWWKKIVGNEGIKLTLQIKPLTALFLMIAFCTIGFGFGRLTLPDPLNQFLPYPTPTPRSLGEVGPSPTPNPWSDTAFTGKLQVTANRYYLVTTSSQAITLEVPPALNLLPLVGKRILAAGSYNADLKLMKVFDTTNLEVLSTKPTLAPTLKPITPTQIPESLLSL